MARTITLFTRTRCSLCDKAKDALARVRAAHPFDLAIIDLDREATAEQKAAYDLEVPVIELDGRKIMKFRVDEGRLRRLLAPLIEHCTELGYRQMIAVIGGRETVASIRLHEALGFTHIGVFPAIGFKFGRWIDTVLMQRALGPGSETLPSAGTPSAAPGG